MSKTTLLSTAAVNLIAAVTVLGAVALARYPDYFRQSGAWTFILEPSCVLIVYLAAAAWLLRVRDPRWNDTASTAITFGWVTGLLEVLNIALENLAPAAMHHPLTSLGAMLLVFSLWGVAGMLTTQKTQRMRSGLVAAVMSAGLCMLIAVAAGFLDELFLAVPDAAAVATWAEYQRSGWSDPHAFGLANTLDSGFTHLLLAPCVAIVFGGSGSLIAKLRGRPKATPRALGAKPLRGGLLS